MRLREIERLAKVRRPPFRRTARDLVRATTVDDLRLAALRRWSRPVRDFVEGGGSESEITVRRNIETFEKYVFLPRQLRDVSQVDTGWDLLGAPAPYPFALAPIGATRIVHHRGELAVARAAARVGISYTRATMATTALGDVAAIPGVDLWLQRYLWRDRSIADRLLDSAAAHGCRALVLTVSVGCIAEMHGTASPCRRC